MVTMTSYNSQYKLIELTFTLCALSVKCATVLDSFGLLPKASTFPGLQSASVLLKLIEMMTNLGSPISVGLRSKTEYSGTWVFERNPFRKTV